MRSTVLRVVVFSLMIAAIQHLGHRACFPAVDLFINEDFEKEAIGAEPSHWKLQTWGNRPQPEISIIKEGERKVCFYEFTEDSNYCTSLFQYLPQLDTNRKMRISFSYKFKGKGNPLLTVSISARPGVCNPCSRTFVIFKPDNKWHKFKKEFPLNSLNPDKSVFELVVSQALKEGDELYFDDIQVGYVSESTSLQIGFSCPPGGILYTDDPTQRLSGTICTKQSYAGFPIQLTISPTNSPKDVLQKIDLVFSYPKTNWEMDLKKALPGNYTIRAELLNMNNMNLLCESQREIQKLAPDDNTVRIIKGTVQYKGKPFLPIGLYHVNPWAPAVINKENERIGVSPLTIDKMLSDIHKQGFNSIFCSDISVPSEEFLDCAAKYNLLVLPGIVQAPTVDDQVRKIKPYARDPRILGWYGVDEPEGPKMTLAVDVYNGYRQISPQRIVCTSSTSSDLHLSFLEKNNILADLLLLDIYNIRSSTADLSENGHHVRKLVSHTKNKPNFSVGIVPQCFIFHGPEPTPEQIRVQTYLGLVNGARAFVFYAYIENYHEKDFTQMGYKGAPEGMSLNTKRKKWWLPDSKIWNSFPQLFYELNELKDVILNDGGMVPFSTTENTSIQFMVKKIKNIIYLIAVNATAEAENIQFQFNALPENTKIVPLFGIPASPLTNGKLTLNFNKYEVKIFQIL